MFDPLYEAMASLLAWIYPIVGNSYGLSIMALTLMVMTVLTPLTIRGTKSMIKMQDFQPEIKRIQAEYKDDRTELNAQMLKLYQGEGISPFGSCLPLLVQMPIFFLLYGVINGITRRADIPEELSKSDRNFNPRHLAEDSAMREALESTNEMLFLGVDLAISAQEALTRSFVTGLPYLAAIGLVTLTSFIQQKQVSGRNPGAEMNQQQKILLRVMPVFFAFISFNFVAALVVYFITSNLYRVVQQGYITRALYAPSSSDGSGGTSGDGDSPDSGPGDSGGGDSKGDSASDAKTTKSSDKKKGGDSSADSSKKGSSKKASSKKASDAASGSSRNGAAKKKTAVKKGRNNLPESDQPTKARRLAKPGSSDTSSATTNRNKRAGGGRVTPKKDRPTNS